MGMESFRVDLYFEEDIMKHNIINAISEKYKIKRNHYTKRYSLKKELIDNEYIINDYIILYCSIEDRYICFEACFSNYDKYLREIIDMFILLNEKFNCKIVINDDILDSSRPRNYCMKIIRNYYEKKYDDFLRCYNLSDTDMLCNSSFYEKVNKVTMKVFALIIIIGVVLMFGSLFFMF